MEATERVDTTSKPSIIKDITAINVTPIVNEDFSPTGILEAGPTTITSYPTETTNKAEGEAVIHSTEPTTATTVSGPVTESIVDESTSTPSDANLTDVMTTQKEIIAAGTIQSVSETPGSSSTASPIPTQAEVTPTQLPTTVIKQDQSNQTIGLTQITQGVPEPATIPTIVSSPSTAGPLVKEDSTNSMTETRGSAVTQSEATTEARTDNMTTSSSIVQQEEQTTITTVAENLQTKGLIIELNRYRIWTILPKRNTRGIKYT